MHRARHARRSTAIVAALALAGSLLAIAVPAAGARPTPRIFFKQVGPISAIARRDAPSSGRIAGPAGIAAEGALVHLFEPEEFEGGEAVIEGEVPAPEPGKPAAVIAGNFGQLAEWEGSNHFDSRYSRNGNQFSGEPPDQGICASNRRVFEIVNSVVQVYTTGGEALLDGDPFFPGTEPVGISLSQFYGTPPELDRTKDPLTFPGPLLFDVVCKYDSSVGRWFVSAEYLDQDPVTGALTGTGGFKLAVSTGRSPLGTFNVWDVRTMNNGTEGTPDHHCSGGFCFGDYPQLGLDANGAYVTTNEFDLLGEGEFHGAQLYAFSKADLVAGAASPTLVHIENVHSDAVADDAYSLQPVDAIRPSEWESSNGGTMYFGMSQSPFFDASASAVSLWRLAHTSTLNSSPDLELTETSVETGEYAVPPFALQRPGPTPLLDCINKFTCIGSTQPHQESPLPIDAGAGKVYGAVLRDGLVYLSTGTALDGPGGASWNEHTGHWKPIDVHSGAAYVVLDPSTTTDAVDNVLQGVVDVPGENLLYPSVILNADGEGAIGVTLVGPDVYPSAAYIPFTTAGATTNVFVSGEGIGPDDGFTGTSQGGYRPRWGDYPGAAVSPNGTMWLANEYIAQRCTFTEWLADSTCGFRRTLFANWSTHIMAYDPS